MLGKEEILLVWERPEDTQPIVNYMESILIPGRLIWNLFKFCASPKRGREVNVLATIDSESRFQWMLNTECQCIWNTHGHEIDRLALSFLPKLKKKLRKSLGTKWGLMPSELSRSLQEPKSRMQSWFFQSSTMKSEAPVKDISLRHLKLSGITFPKHSKFTILNKSTAFSNGKRKACIETPKWSKEGPVK